MNCYFLKMEPLTKGFVVDDRVVWIEIEGLPLGAWSANAYKKIAAKWGEVMFLDDDEECAISLGRVCVKVASDKKVQGCIDVVVEGMSYVVDVKEVGAWCPSITKLVEREEEDGETELDEESEEEDDGDDEQEVKGKEEGGLANKFEFDQKTSEGSSNRPDESQKKENMAGEDGTDKIKFNDVNVEEDCSTKVKETQFQNSNKKDDGSWGDESIKVGEKQKDSNGTTPSKPPGFEKEVGAYSENAAKGRCTSNGWETVRRNSFSGSSMANGGKRRSFGTGLNKTREEVDDFFLINNMSRFIEIGHVLGHDMQGCKEALSGIVKNIGVKKGNP